MLLLSHPIQLKKYQLVVEDPGLINAIAVLGQKELGEIVVNLLEGTSLKPNLPI